MTDIIFETARAIIIGVIFLYLSIQGWRKNLRLQRGWFLIQCGFGLLLIGSLVDITDNFPALNRFVIIGQTEYEAFLEKIVGYTMGFLLLAGGFWEWLPTVIALSAAQNALRESETTYRGLLDSLGEAVYVIDEKGTFIDVNKGAERMYGYTRDELIGRSLAMVSAEGRNDLGSVADLCQRVYLGEHQALEFWGVTSDGRIFPKEVNLYPGNYFGRKAIIAIARDITERKKAEEALQNSETRFRAIYDNIGNGIAVIEKNMEISALNQQMQRWFPHIDLKEPHLCYRSFNSPPRENVCDYCPTIHTLNDGQIHTAVTETPTPDGMRYYKIVSTPLMNANGAIESAIELVEDITERKLAEEQIQQNLKEKETLLKEIHHRVKNNMAVVSGLLSLQAKAIKDETMKGLFDESRQRIKAMALIHEKLYRTDNLSLIDFNDYINSIVTELMYLYCKGERTIHTNINVRDIKLDIDTAIPCGLIINELVTNAIKYAFPENAGGELRLHFEKTAHTYTLIIKDNGVGLPAGFDHTKSTTLGLQLVEALTRQIGGTVQFLSDAATHPGTEVIVTFREKEQGAGL